MQRFWIDHAILFGDQEPRGFRFPCRRWGRLLNALNCDRPLHSGCSAGLIERSLVGNGSAKPIIRHPDKAMGVGSQLRRFRMRWVSIEYLGHGLALIRRERRHIDERLDSFLVSR